MAKPSVWRGLHELVEAKEKAKDIERELESLQKRQRAASGLDIKAHGDRLVSDVNETIALVEEKFREIIESLENHKKRVKSVQEFQKRHYRFK